MPTTQSKSPKPIGANPPAVIPETAVITTGSATANSTAVTAPRTIEDTLKARMLAGQGIKAPLPRMVKVNYDADTAPAGSFVVSEQTTDPDGNPKTVFKPLAEQRLDAVILKIRLQVKGEYDENTPPIV